jgi:hypothetical protein
MTSPVERLARDIFRAAIENSEVLKERIEGNDDADKDERRLLVIFEWLYFFMHLANRMAYRELGQPGRLEIQKKLLALTARPAIEGLMGHWPDRLKVGMTREFVRRLNEAELDYAKCKTWVEEGKPFSEDSLFGKLALNIARVMGPHCSDDVALLLYIRDTATTACARLDMLQLIRQMKEDL